ncbi:MAG: alpha/beta fold hydrolase [Anaerolineales bacterium]
MTVEPNPISVRDGKWNPPVYRAGKGEPLLWLHGAGGMNRGWTPELAALAESYDVIAPVHPGWDDTPGLEDIDDIHDMVVYLQDLAEALRLDRFNLGGHSLGAMFAAELAAARPDLVKKLVLTCPVGLWMDESPVTDLFTLMPNELPRVLFGDLTNPVIAELFKPPANEDELAQAMYLQLANFSATGKFIWPIPDKGLKKRLHRIKAPTLIIWGDQDNLAPPAYGPLFQSKIARSQLATIQGAGHMVPLENTPAFASEVTAFLG